MIHVCHHAAALLFADQGSGAASVLSTKNPGFFLLDKENLAFFSAALSPTNLSIPWLGFEERILLLLCNVLRLDPSDNYGVMGSDAWPLSFASTSHNAESW